MTPRDFCAAQSAAVLMARHDRMERAFRFVCPSAHASKLLGHDNHTASWRDPIAAVVVKSELDSAGLGIEDVIDAVIYMTAASVTATTERVGRVGKVDHHGAAGWLVSSVGYRMGPAGDH